MRTIKYVSMGAFFLLLTVSGISQVSKDSINVLKQQKESLELSSKINEHKMQLAKLENTVNAKHRKGTRLLLKRKRRQMTMQPPPQI